MPYCEVVRHFVIETYLGHYQKMARNTISLGKRQPKNTDGYTNRFEILTLLSIVIELDVQKKGGL